MTEYFTDEIVNSIFCELQFSETKPISIQMLVKMVTVDQPIQQSLIASLYNEKSEPEDYLVIVSDVNLHFYSFLGEDILRALPFHGARVWALSPSLLIHVSCGHVLGIVSCYFRFHFLSKIFRFHFLSKFF